MLFFNKKKVLIIDDDSSLQRLLRFRLETNEKVDVIEAIDGETGLVLANESNPDVIILDWMLPGLQGDEVLALLRSNDVTKNTPIIMLTGKNKIGEIENAFTLGSDDYLTKPFSLQKLGEKVHELLNPNNTK